MKAVKYLILAVVLSAILFPAACFAGEWYLIDMNTMQCVQNDKANAYEMKRAGVNVRKVHEALEGAYIVSISGSSLFVADSREMCEKLLELMKK
ncbi:hypothetical protein [Maridesulfovibrio sp.]|uniref:hypothetical protein n=1 Tax=Maridesulfovibrio sp. TaxID=2795000 RepID=UPI002A18B988|nr:hypothetical protein [Maridesulfovibrio sp.]